MLYGCILLDVCPEDYVAPPLLAKIRPIRVYVALAREDAVKVTDALPLLLVLYQILQVCLIRAQE